MKRLLMTSLLAATLALPAAALVPSAVEVEYTVGMPLAVTEVVEVGVPARQVEQVVYRLNTARVPVVDSVEIVRYSAFPMVVDRYYEPARPLYFEPVGLETQWELDELDMLTLLAAHFDDGLEGQLLSDALFRDLLVLGFDVGVNGVWRTAPQPVRREFLYYVEPGYRFATDRGVFRDRVVVVADDDFDDYWVRRNVRFRDRDRDVFDLAFDRDRDRVVVRDRDRVIDRDRVVVGRVESDAVPPGHRKHGPGGPHPTPGHVKHAGPDGPPGHARDGDRVVLRELDRDGRRVVLRDRDRDDRRESRVDRDRGERRGKAPKAKADRGQGGGKGKAKAGPAGRSDGKGKKAAGNRGGGGNDKGKGKGNGKGGGGKGRGR